MPLRVYADYRHVFRAELSEGDNCESAHYYNREPYLELKIKQPRYQLPLLMMGASRFYQKELCGAPHRAPLLISAIRLMRALGIAHSSAILMD